jgi:hypothetical protein
MSLIDKMGSYLQLMKLSMGTLGKEHQALALSK